MRSRFVSLASVFLLCVAITPAQSEIVTPSMKLIHTINGSIAPKSVRSSADGVVSAHNMMYRHSVTVYDAKTFELLHTVSDSVSLKDFGFSKSAGNYKGSPVEELFHLTESICMSVIMRCMARGITEKELTLVRQQINMTIALYTE